MTAIDQLREITKPTPATVTPKDADRKKVDIYELVNFADVKIRGEEPVLRELGDRIKAGDTVTVLSIEECTTRAGRCELCNVRGPDPRKHFVIRLDEAEVTPLN